MIFNKLFVAGKAMEIKMTKTNRVLSVFLVLVTLFTMFGFSQTAYAGTTKSQSAYNAVSKAYGKKFPLTSKNKIKSKTRVMGVRTSYMKNYYAASATKGKGKSQAKYTVFICEAKNKSNVNKIKSALEDYVENEEISMSSYLSKTGKKLYKNAKVGTKGKYVYLVMLDTSKNTKAIKALKKALK